MKRAVLAYSSLLLIMGTIPSAAKVTTIEFVCNDAVEIRQGTYERAVKEFQAKHPDIRVKYSLMNNGDFIQYLLVRAAAGNMPDVFYNRCQYTDMFASRGLILNLDSLIKRDKLDMSDLWTAQLPELKYNGSFYCMPENYSTTGIIYNVDIAKEAGVVIPNTPWSWDELWLAATKLAKKDASNKATRFGFSCINSGWLTLGLYQGASGSVYGPGNKSVAMGVPANVALLEKMQEMMAKGVLDSGWADFGAKKVAMILDGSWSVDIWRKQLKKNHFNLAYVPNGAFTKLPSVTNTGASYAIAANTKKLRAAWEWVKFLTSPEVQKYVVVDKLLTVPARKSTAKAFAEKVRATGDPVDAQIWLDTAERGWSVPSTPYHDDLLRSLSEEVGSFVAKKKSAAAALKAVDTKVNEIIRRKQKK